VDLKDTGKSLSDSSMALVPKRKGKLNITERNIFSEDMTTEQLKRELEIKDALLQREYRNLEKAIDLIDSLKKMVLDQALEIGDQKKKRLQKLQRK